MSAIIHIVHAESNPPFPDTEELTAVSLTLELCARNRALSMIECLDMDLTTGKRVVNDNGIETT